MADLAALKPGTCEAERTTRTRLRNARANDPSGFVVSCELVSLSYEKFPRTCSSRAGTGVDASRPSVLYAKRGRPDSCYLGRA